jgi:hypothetical protein
VNPQLSGITCGRSRNSLHFICILATSQILQYTPPPAQSQEDQKSPSPIPLYFLSGFSHDKILASCRHWDPPPPSPAGKCAPPLGTKGGAHSPAGEGVEESHLQRLEKKLSTLFTDVIERLSVHSVIQSNVAR